MDMSRDGLSERLGPCLELNRVGGRASSGLNGRVGLLVPQVNAGWARIEGECAEERGGEGRTGILADKSIVGGISEARR